MGSLKDSGLMPGDVVLRPVSPGSTTRVPILTPLYSMTVDIATD